MATGFAAVPATARYLVRRARVPVCLVEGVTLRPDEDGLASVNLVVADGRIERLSAGADGQADGLEPAPAVLDMDDGLVLPCFVDLHTHLDKGHIWPRRRNRTGTFEAALDAVRDDREAHWSEGDVEARMEFALRCAHAHGTAAVRTHLDSTGPQTAITWPVFERVRERWAGRIALQGVALFGIEAADDPAHLAAVRDALRRHGRNGSGLVGGATHGLPGIEAKLDALFRLAAEEGADLDFHVDETQDPEARTLDAIAQATLRHNLGGRVTVGHCCSLARQPDGDARATIERVAEAGLAVVSLPMCNLYLQDRRPAGGTPRQRGVTLLHEFAAAGVPVAVASDNTRDPFHAYGDLDALEVYREATRIAHLDAPVGEWPRAVTATPARIMGLEAGMVREGAPADLVLLRARSMTELLSRPQSDRTVLRAGAPIDTTPPDYRELDAVVGRP